jgi:hypothetical protein
MEEPLSCGFTRTIEQHCHDEWIGSIVSFDWMGRGEGSSSVVVRCCMSKRLGKSKGKKKAAD